MFANVPQSVYDYTAHGDGGEWNLRRNRQAFDWVDLLPGRAVDPCVGRSLIAAARSQAEVSDRHCADGHAGRAASRRRGRHVSRGHALVEHTDVPQQQLEPVDRAGRQGRAGPALVAVLPSAGHGREPGVARACAGGGLHGDRRHGRSAGVVLRAQPARSQSRRPHRWCAGRARWSRSRGGGSRAAVLAASRPRAGARVGHSCIALAAGACGTPGNIWTRSGSSSRFRSSSKAS